MIIDRQYLSELPARFFEEISAIPRVSLQEGEIADYLERFAAARGLYCYRDAAHNVLIKKPGTPGREAELPLMLQAHTDMVTEVAFGRVHDFGAQGVKLCRKDNLLFADGTTLGADDGYGVCLMLAALEGGAESHPPLECLFTAAEEIGLVGAGQFDYDKVSARRMLNFDSAEEHLIITGCCGGLRSDFTLPICRGRVEGTALRLTLNGLCGGHSGEDIDRGRANALIVMGELLKALAARTAFRIVSFVGGDKTNAIPRDCVAEIIPQDLAAATAFFENVEQLLAALVTSPDDKARFSIESCDAGEAMSASDGEKLLRVLSVRNGVFYRRTDGKPAPETSRNLARVRTTEKEIAVALSSRSPFDARLQESSDELNALALALGGNARHYAYYPGWEGAEDSPVSKLWQSCYCAQTGKSVSATVLHAGLECGLISSKLPGLDVISVGCNIYDLHTPAERMELDSLERIYRTMIAFLKAC